MAGAAAVALAGARHADVGGHHPHALARVGQKSVGAADGLHDDHDVRGRHGLAGRPRPATGPPVLSGPIPLSDRPRRAGHLFHACRRLTEDQDGRTAPLTTTKTYSPLVSDRSPAHPRHNHEQSSGPGADLARGQGQHESESADPRGTRPDCHRSFTRWASRIRVAHPGGAEMGLTTHRKL
jgi:hypothetical protein